MRRFRDPIKVPRDPPQKGPPAPTCVRSGCGVVLGDRNYLPRGPVHEDGYAGPYCGVCREELLGLLPPARERWRLSKAA